MLSNLDKHLREPAVIDDSLRDRRDMWVMLYRASIAPGAPASTNERAIRGNLVGFAAAPGDIVGRRLFVVAWRWMLARVTWL